MIHILHAQTDELLGLLDNKGERIYWDDNHTQGTDGYNVFQFVTFADIEESNYLGKRSRIIIPSESGDWQEFIIFESNSNTAREMEIVAVGSETDIDKQIIIEPQKFDGRSAEQMLNVAIDNTEWKIGDIEYGGTRTFDVEEYIGGYELLRKIEKEFGMELQFRTVVDGNTVVGRYVDLIIAIGEDNAKEIKYGKDLVGIDRKIFSDRIVTAIYAVGPEREDGTRHTSLEVNDEAFQRWNRKGNHIIGIHEVESDDADMTVKRLKTLGQMELKKRIDAVTEYTVTAESIEKEYPHEKVRLGDMVRVIDTEFTPPLYATARVISVTRTLDDSLPKEYIIGNVVEYDADELRAAFKGMQKQYGTTIVRNPVPPNGKYNVIWVDTSGRIDVPYTWNGDEWVKFSPTVAGDIGAETPAGSQNKAEIENIKTIKRILNTNQVNLNQDFELLDGNTYIEGTIYRDELDAAKLDATDKWNFVNNMIDDVLLDDVVTSSERGNLITAINEAETAQSIFHNKLSQAFEQVAAAQALEAKQQAEIAEQAANDAFVKAEQALTDVVSKVDQSAYDTAIGELIDELGDKADIQYVDGKIASIDAGIAVQDTAPTAPELHDLWMDTTTEVLKRWDGTEWIAAEVDLSGLNIYTKSEMESKLLGYITETTYSADQAGLIADISQNTTDIGQNATAITLRATQIEVDALSGNVSDNAAAILVNAQEIALKVDSTTITNLTDKVDGLEANVELAEIRLSEAEFKLSDSEIISTVTTSTSFEAMFNTKANASDLEGFASSEAVSNMLADLESLGEEFRGISFGDFVTSSELAQRDLSLIATISASSGVNLIKNSVGLARLEHWDTSGNGSISPTGNPELDGLGYYSGFLLQGGTGVTRLQQDVAVVQGKDYTLSFALRNINTTGNIVVNIINAVTGAIVKTAPTFAEADGNYKVIATTIENFPSKQLRVQVVIPTNKQAIITAIMLNIGDVPFSWTTAVGELYNTTIKMDLTGLRVSQYVGNKETGFTVMTPEKFAGYYNESGIINENIGSSDEVFRMDEDEFVMKKAVIKEEITMGTIKVIEFNDGVRKGWAFVPELG